MESTGPGGGVRVLIRLCQDCIKWCKNELNGVKEGGVRV